MNDNDSKYSGCLYYSSNTLGRVMTRMAEEEFSITGLAPSYAFLLMSVNDKPGIQPCELSEQMQLSPSTVTRLIEKMEHRVYVTRKTNGKFTKVYPTEESLKLDMKIKKAWRNLYNRYTTLLGEGKGDELTVLVYAASKKLDF